MAQVDPEVVKESARWLQENKSMVLGAGTYDSPRISSEIADCSMPMTFDHFNLCSKGCAYCVVEGTLISVPKREKKIELLNVGDPIYTKNIESNSVDIDIISSVMERTVGEVLEITLENGSLIKITEEHPVYVKNYGWKKAGDLVEGDDVEFSGSPASSYNMRINNPMFKKEIKEKAGKTLKKKWNSGELDGLRKVFKDRIVEYRKHHPYKLTEKGKKIISDKMKSNNPMKNPETAKKAGTRLRERYANGELIGPWQGKSKPDAVHRMLTNNPMKDPKIRRPTLQKIVASYIANGRVSKGELCIKKALTEMKLNFIHQHMVSSEQSEYFLDFFLPDVLIGIEYDGHSNHYTNTGKEKDSKRDKWVLDQYGIKTIRIHRDTAFIPQQDLQNLLRKLLAV